MNDWKTRKAGNSSNNAKARKSHFLSRFWAVSIFALALGTVAFAQNNSPTSDGDTQAQTGPRSTTPVEIVAVDECDPNTFNAALGPNFCKNVSFEPFTTTLSDLFSKAQSGTPDPNWDFEPDTVTIKYGTPLIIVNEGGEPHTFTEVKQFGGGFAPNLNAPGESAVPACQGGFSKVSVAKTRILQGSQIEITGLSKGVHLFQCCIHPWMRVKVIVK